MQLVIHIVSENTEIAEMWVVFFLVRTNKHTNGRKFFFYIDIRTQIDVRSKYEN